MSQYVETATKAFVAAEAIPQYARVSMHADGKIYLSLKTEKDLGTIESAAFAAGDVRAVRLRTAVGTAKMIANVGIAEGVAVWSDVLGRITNAAGAAVGAWLVGTSLEAAAAQGEIIEILRNSHGDTANP